MSAGFCEYVCNSAVAVCVCAWRWSSSMIVHRAHKHVHTNTLAVATATARCRVCALCRTGNLYCILFYVHKKIFNGLCASKRTLGARARARAGMRAGEPARSTGAACVCAMCKAAKPTDRARARTRRAYVESIDISGSGGGGPRETLLAG